MLGNNSNFFGLSLQIITELQGGAYRSVVHHFWVKTIYYSARLATFFGKWGWVRGIIICKREKNNRQCTVNSKSWCATRKTAAVAPPFVTYLESIAIIIYNYQKQTRNCPREKSILTGVYHRQFECLTNEIAVCSMWFNEDTIYKAIINSLYCTLFPALQPSGRRVLINSWIIG